MTEARAQHRPVSPAARLATLAAVVLPFLGLLTAAVLLWGVAFHWAHAALLAGMYLLTAGGIGVGFHRLFTHRSFRTGRVATFVLGVLGSMAAEGPLLTWVATHRKHHQHSDGDEDPHSPHAHRGGGVLGFLKGFWRAHAGWFFEGSDDDLPRYAGDLRKDPMLRAVSRLFPLWVALGLAIPAALGGLLTLSWTGALLGLLWGGLVRMFLVHHVTWSVNSVCHLWGSRPFRSDDESRNNPVFGVLALGEGWHNNHHAFPTSARHGLRWWEIDVNYLVIRAMALAGLATNVRVPTPERIETKRRRPRGGASLSKTYPQPEGPARARGPEVH